MSAVCTAQSHLDLFPCDRLVYLSPDSPNDLGYDVCSDVDSLAEAVFVIGGLNESPSGMTLMQAEQQGIRHARLPMQRHLGSVVLSTYSAKIYEMQRSNFTISFISLAIDLSIVQVVKIINDYRLTKDWLYSLRWVPSRFWADRFLGHE